MRTAVITPVHGRHRHFSTQQRVLQDCEPPPDLRIVVAIDDQQITDLAGDAVVITCPDGRHGLPLAAARNAGAAAALAAGAELLIFLDVDCLPRPGTVGSYLRAAAGPAGSGLLAGTVAYLPPPPAGGYDLRRLAEHPPHPARPVPVGTDLSDADHRLFWSLSFALRAEVWERLGGFDEAYEGYGAEDTDFGQRARSAGIGLTWVDGAEAAHQWHPSGNPPLQHLDDILRNGAIFARRWGFWPMTGWLERFAALGLVKTVGHDWVRA